ncbi:MAG: hypothetical protein AB8E82_02205 [Aureispira sp.]
MIKIPPTVVNQVKFPTLRLWKGDWISFALPAIAHSHQLLGAYCKHIQFHTNRGIFEHKQTFQWLNLTHTNTLFSRTDTVRALIEQESNVNQEMLLEYAEKELKIDLDRRIKYVDATQRVVLLYELKKQGADLITVSMSGLEPWGIHKIRTALKQDQQDNRVIEFCYAVSRRYNIATESTLIKLTQGKSAG